MSHLSLIVLLSLRIVDVDAAVVVVVVVVAADVVVVGAPSESNFS